MTLLFTDVERSTLLVERHGAAGTEALIRHHAIVREIAEANGGRLFERIGDAAYSSFPTRTDALAAAIAIHTRLAAEDWGPMPAVRVRTALDTGELEESEGRFFGRILPLRPHPVPAGGGETLLSETTAAAVADTMPGGHRLRDLGEQKLRGLAGTARVWGVVPAPVHADREPGAMIRVLLVDDYEVVRRGLRGFLELMPQIEIIGEASNGSRRWTSPTGCSRT